MSMSKKIFGVILLLVAVSVVITAVSVAGMRRINASTEQLGRLAARAVNLTVMDRILQQRGEAVLRIILNTDAAAIRKITDERFRPTEKAMEAEIADFTNHLPANPTEEMRQQPEEIKKRWTVFVKATEQVAETAKINSNQQANSLVMGREAQWDAMDAEMGALLAAARDTEGATRAWGSRLADSRVDLALFRLWVTNAVVSEDPARIKACGDEAFRRMHRLQDAMKAGAGLPGVFGDAAGKYADFLEKTGIPGMEGVLKLASINSNAEAMNEYTRRADPAFEDMAGYTGELAAEAIDGQARALAEAHVTGDRVNTAAIAVAVAGIVIGSLLAFLIVSRIIRNLNLIIGGLDESSTQVAAAAGMITSASQALADGATEQAASLEETSSALEEMASMTRQNADNSAKTADTTHQNVQLIGEGAKAVENMSGAMAEISDSAEKIGNIIKTIEEIAFQTNLLALNAAVEAARAGDAGKGFAVVADEVRNLAQRSAQAARDTAELIQGTVTRVKNGSEIAAELDASFREIDLGAQGVGKLVGEISAATSEQAQGVDQVNTAVAQMDKVTQSNAASAEECASASEQLSAQAEGLKGMVDNLVALVTGARRSGEGGGAPRRKVRDAFSTARSGGGLKQLPAPGI